MDALLAMPMFGQPASDQARMTDIIFMSLLGMSLVVVLFIFGLMLRFIVRYRAGSRSDRTGPVAKTWKFEVAWLAGSIVVALVLFVWAAWQYYGMAKPPVDATTYYVTGRQWMWEVQHPSGVRELNGLHLPVGQPVRLVVTSEDVVHSFYVPAFHIKRDAVPGRYNVTWFRPTKVGRFHLFCAEYCGADHSRMTGWVTVMEPEAYAAWLAGQPDAPTAQPMEQTGLASFRKLGCNQCHKPDTERIAPRLEGLFGKTVTLRNGQTVRADEQYIRESIIEPAAKVVKGYQPIMPTYKGLLDAQQLQQLVAAVRGLENSTKEPVTR